MPFVTRDIIKPYISEQMYSALTRIDDEDWDLYEAAAARQIRDATGFAVPDDVDDRPDWIDTIAAAIIESLSAPLIGSTSAEAMKRIDDNLKRAEKRMAMYRTTPADGAPTTGTISYGGFTAEERI